MERPAADAMSLAFTCDLILEEILVRLDSPFCLACTAVVCWRWNVHARLDHVLARFRERQALHPRSRPLGFYVRFLVGPGNYRTKFVAMRQHRDDLTDIVRRARFGFGYENHVYSDNEGDVDILHDNNEDSGGDSGPRDGSHGDADDVDGDGENSADGSSQGDCSDDNTDMDEHSLVLDCRDGRVLILQDVEDSFGTFALRRPMEPERVLDIVSSLLRFSHYFDFSFLPDDRVSTTTCSVLNVVIAGGIYPPAALLRLLILQANSWADHCTFWPLYPCVWGLWMDRVLAHDNIYTLYFAGPLICINISNPDELIISAIATPVSSFLRNDNQMILARADDSGLYLLEVKDLELKVWIHRTEGGEAGDWVLEQSIPLLIAFGDLSDNIVESKKKRKLTKGFICLFGAGDNAEFVFLAREKFKQIYYMNLRTRKVEIVYERGCEDGDLMAIHPYLMI